jgi:hypothetical protein
MNLLELCGVVYLAITAGGNSSKDAYKALGVVVAWIIAGAVWVAVNTARQGHTLLPDRPQRLHPPVPPNRPTTTPVP